MPRQNSIHVKMRRAYNLPNTTNTNGTNSTDLPSIGQSDTTTCKLRCIPRLLLLLFIVYFDFCCNSLVYHLLRLLSPLVTILLSPFATTSISFVSLFAMTIISHCNSFILFPDALSLCFQWIHS